MNPANATSKTDFGDESHAWAEALAALDLDDIRRHMAEEMGAAGEEDEDEDEDDEDDDDDDEDEDEDEDDEDEDEEDEVPTANRGNETLKSAGGTNDDDADAQSHSDITSDRVPATDAEPEGSLDHVKTAPLKIHEIESLEDDAKGG